MTAPIISIIIPVYNVEKYLQRCLDSIICQTITVWECILINDGSSDNSGKICDEYAQKDDRFKVIHQENAGVSAARNAGLDVARGEWIGFVDSDDWIEKDYIEVLLSKARKGCLIIGSIKNIGGNPPNTIGNEEEPSDYFITQLFGRGKYGYVGFIFPKLYDSSIIRNEHIRFNKDIHYNEDRLFVLQYTLHCDKVIMCDNVLYNYFQRDDSAMGLTLTTFSSKMITELNAFEKMQELLQHKNKTAYLQCSKEAYDATLSLLNRCDNQSKTILNNFKKHFFKTTLKAYGWKDKVIFLIHYYRYKNQYDA